MAIGSAPEIGYQFTVWRDMSPATREAWFNYMRTHWSENLYAGEASIVFPDSNQRKHYYDEIMREVAE